MNSLLYINWDFDPVLFHLGPIAPRWYSLGFVLSFGFGYYIINNYFRKGGVPEKWMDSLTMYMFIGTIAGARLGEVLFYRPDYYLAHPVEILKIWEGGLASHGAALGIILSLFLWSRKISKRSVLWILDRIVIVVALSGLFIRFGNLTNSELVGNETTSPFGFVFTDTQPYGLKAKWAKDHTTIEYFGETNQYSRRYSVYKSDPEGKVTQLEDGITVPPYNADWISYTDNSGNGDHSSFILLENDHPKKLNISSMDSMNPRKAIIGLDNEDPWFGVSGIWRGDSLILEISVLKSNQSYVIPGIAMEKTADGSWKVLSEGGIKTGNEIQYFRLALKPQAEEPEFRFGVIENKVRLSARHPVQLYEAFTYFCIFIFLTILYKKKNGKIPYGQFFGYFLVLVFGARIVLEVFKAQVADFMTGFSLDMGQLLSIPFVLGGIYFIIRSNRKGKMEMENEIPVPESEFEKGAKK